METTQMNLHANLELKEKALQRTPAAIPPKRPAIGLPPEPLTMPSDEIKKGAIPAQTAGTAPSTRYYSEPGKKPLCRAQHNGYFYA